MCFLFVSEGEPPPPPLFLHFPPPALPPLALVSQSSKTRTGHPVKMLKNKNLIDNRLRFAATLMNSQGNRNLSGICYLNVFRCVCACYISSNLGWEF